MPASPALAGAEVELVNEPRRELKLEKVVLSVRERYDYILVDSPPSLGLLTINGLVAAKDGIIIPVQCEYLPLEGLSQLTQTIDLVRSSLFHDLKIRGVILTMFYSRTNLATDVVEEVRKHFPGKVFKSIIPRSIRWPRRLLRPTHSVYDQFERRQSLCRPGVEILSGDNEIDDRDG